MMQQASLREREHSETADRTPARPAAGKAERARKKRRRLRFQKPLPPHSQHKHDPQEGRVQHELAELRETHDLTEIDDDVKAEATFYEWEALEHTHRPKSPRWFAVLAAGTTVLVALQILLYFNPFGAAAIAVAGALIYYIAQREPQQVRYRIMLDGVAMNDVFYHWKDLNSFNVVYEPGETRTVLLRGERRFSPLLHMEIGDADPVEIRSFLIEFLPEDQDLEEPLADILARIFGF